MLNLYYLQTKSGMTLGRHSARERAVGDRDRDTTSLTASRLLLLLEDKPDRDCLDEGRSDRSTSDDRAL
jgi:hypothetical protein